ncbi:MAG: aminoglycoside N(3)-acetyltransferase [Actinomycetes bacterium]
MSDQTGDEPRDQPLDQPGPRPGARPGDHLHTRPELARDLAALGVRPGETLLVHTSVKALGWIPGGPLAVVQALRDALGPSGTVVVPTQTGDNTDPAGWRHPPVPEPWWQPIREHTPAFDPALTPSRGMGAVPEIVRRLPGAQRSSHPTTSFAAHGPRSREVVAVHDLDCQCGDRSPLAALERLGARVLLLGAGFDSCTAFHLAEYRTPNPPRTTLGSAVLVGGERRWASYDDVDLDEGDFDRIGAAFRETGAVSSGRVGEATAHLFDLREAVSFATGWMTTNRHPAGS